jgi:hypothetical protein
MSESKEVATINLGANALNLPSKQEWDYIKEICLTAIKSGLLPTSVKTPEAAAIIALKSREMGISLMDGFSNIFVIGGKAGYSAELIESQARKNYPGLVFNILKTTNDHCTVEGCRPERGSIPLKLTFSIEDAKRAELLSNPSWRKYPAAMLRARATTECLRALRVTRGSYTPEELGANVNEDGSVIDTTGRRISDDAIEPKQQDPKVTIIQNDNDIDRMSYIKTCSQLMEELAISNEDAQKVLYESCGAQSLKNCTIDQIKQFLVLLTTEKSERENAVSSKIEDKDPASFNNFNTEAKVVK